MDRVIFRSSLRLSKSLNPKPIPGLTRVPRAEESKEKRSRGGGEREQIVRPYAVKGRKRKKRIMEEVVDEEKDEVLEAAEGVKEEAATEAEDERRAEEAVEMMAGIPAIPPVEGRRSQASSSCSRRRIWKSAKSDIPHSELR